MLEFLGLQAEANQIMVTTLIIAGLIGFALGGSMANGEKTTKFWKVSNIISAIIGILLVIFGAIPAIKLFFTFQWAYLLRPVFIGIPVGIVTFCLGFFPSNAARKRKYRRNPVMREALEFCRENRVVAVQCFEDRLRFFNDLVNEDYCRPYSNTYEASNGAASYTFQSSWQRPKSWQEYDNPPCLVGVLSFAERNYPNLPDLGFFAQVLAKELGGCEMVAHNQTTKYDTTTYKDGNKTITHYTTWLYKDCFVYKKSAREKKFPPVKVKTTNSETRKQAPKSWE